MVAAAAAVVRAGREALVEAVVAVAAAVALDVIVTAYSSSSRYPKLRLASTS